MVLVPPSARAAADGGAGRPVRSAAAPIVLVGTALVALAAALVLAGSVAAGGPVPAVQVGRPVAQLLLTLAASGCVGALVTAAWSSSPAAPQWGRLLDAAAACAGVWTVAAAAGAFLLYLTVSPDPGSAAFGPNLLVFLTAVEAGRTWAAAVVAAAVLTALPIIVRSHTGAGLLVPAAAAALVPIALLGHASDASGDHATAVVALGLHVVGAAAWLGGLAVLAVLGAGMRAPALADAARRYSDVALVCFLVVGFSGVVSAVIRLGSPAGLTTPYGALVLVKTATLIAAGAIGALHRRAVIPRIAAGPGRTPFLRLVLVELVVLGIAAGFAAALTASAPPEQQVTPLRTPAQVLTGSALPPPPGPATLVTQWRPDPLWTLIGAAMVVAYLVGVHRATRRGGWPMRRTAAWLVGTVLLLWLTDGAPNRYQEVLFSAHLPVLAALAVPVPLLLVLGAPVALLRTVARPRGDGTRGALEWTLVARRSRAAALLARPVVAAVVLLVVLAAAVWSPLLDWAATDRIGHECVTVLVLAAGCAAARALLAAGGRGALAALLVIAGAAAGGAVLATGSGLLLPDWYGAMGWGTSALADQRLGGALAGGLAAGGALLVAAAAVLRTRVGRRPA